MKIVKIDNNYLKEYLLLDREIKEKQKKHKQMKEEITNELETRKGKAIVTRFFIAMFQLMKRINYKVPTDIKKKYQQETEYNLLKVTERRPDLAIGDKEELKICNKKLNSSNKATRSEGKKPSTPSSKVKGLK